MLPHLDLQEVVVQLLVADRLGIPVASIMPTLLLELCLLLIGVHSGLLYFVGDAHLFGFFAVDDGVVVRASHGW